MNYNAGENRFTQLEEEKEERNKILSSFFYSGCFIIILWLIQFIQWAADMDISVYGVLPRKKEGLIGILTAPLIHADFSHLISNSVTLFMLLFGILYFYRTSAVKVFFIIYIMDGFFVWLLARESYHIGASGLVYGFASFLFFSGLFRKDKRSVALSLLIVFLYGGMVWGVLPTDPKISFESHLFGAVIGVICAFIFRKNDPPPLYDWEEEDYEDEIEDDTDPDEVEIEDDAEPDDFRRN
ncbi:MAG: rhomboid family intramembrane serine protease [Ignavibacteria bacterium]|nr:rhomboid family intramembrane serine protease [Ignavibacteria bacterium]